MPDILENMGSASRARVIVMLAAASSMAAGPLAVAAPEDPARIADTQSMRCSRVEIRLPDTIVFFSATGESLRARVSTNLTAGLYTLRYAADEQRMVVSPWPDANAIVREITADRVKSARVEYEPNG